MKILCATFGQTVTIVCAVFVWKDCVQFGQTVKILSEEAAGGQADLTS